MDLGIFSSWTDLIHNVFASWIIHPLVRSGPLSKIFLCLCVSLSECMQWKPGLSRNCICYSWPATIGGGGRVWSLHGSLRAIQTYTIRNQNPCITYARVLGLLTQIMNMKEKKVPLSFLTSPCHTHVEEQLEKGHNGNWNNVVMRIATTIQGDTFGQFAVGR